MAARIGETVTATPSPSPAGPSSRRAGAVDDSRSASNGPGGCYSARVSEAVLEIVDLALTASVRRTTFEPVTQATVRVHAAEVVGLVGESGSGKTLTALASLALLPDNVRVGRGSVTVAGQDLAGLDDTGLAALRGGTAAIVFQDSLGSLNPTMTIGRQVTETVTLHGGVGRAAAEEQALEALDQVGLPQPRARFGAYPHQLSGGQRQRVAIAMAIAGRPRLLVADEPTSALDVTIQAQILELLSRLARDLRMGVLLITHDLGVVAAVADRVSVMYGGRTAEAGGTSALFTGPLHPYTEALARSAPTLSRKLDGQRGIPGLPPDPRHPQPGCPFAPRCSYATETCRAAPPPLELVAAGREVACYHPLTHPRGHRA